MFIIKCYIIKIKKRIEFKRKCILNSNFHCLFQCFMNMINVEVNIFTEILNVSQLSLFILVQH